MLTNYKVRLEIHPLTKDVNVMRKQLRWRLGGTVAGRMVVVCSLIQRNLPWTIEAIQGLEVATAG